MNDTKVERTEVGDFKVLGNKILLEYVLPETKTKSGILLVSDATDKSQKNYVGFVKKIGPEAVNKGVSIGDKVIFAKGRQYDLHLRPDSETNDFPSHCLLSWYDILAVVEEGDDVIVH